MTYTDISYCSILLSHSAVSHNVLHFCTLTHTVLKHARQRDCVREAKTHQTSIQLWEKRSRVREKEKNGEKMEGMKGEGPLTMQVASLPLGLAS